MRCCCGSYDLDDNEPIIINDKIHQVLGPEGNFCGPYKHFLIYELQKENELLKDKLSKIKDYIESVYILEGKWVDDPPEIIKNIYRIVCEG